MDNKIIAYVCGMLTFWLYDNIKEKRRKKKLALKAINEKGKLKINPPATIIIKNG
jgi:hypothetical protein